MTSEGFKGAVHAAAMSLAATMALYNLGEAASERRTRRHVINVVVYISAVVWEGYNVHAHWSSAEER